MLIARWRLFLFYNNDDSYSHVHNSALIILAFTLQPVVDILRSEGGQSTSYSNQQSLLYMGLLTAVPFLRSRRQRKYIIMAILNVAT